MARSFDKLKELDLSRDEVERIGEALKKPEFRKLLIDYVEELQDPKNKQLYQEEITLLEKERGIDVTFIDPKPGYVLKTSVNGNQKAFINICCNEHISKPSSSPSFQEGTKGLSWSLPYSLSSPHEDVDKKGVRCQVFDVVFNPDTLHLASNNKAFRTMVNDTALEAVESNFDVKLDKKNIKFPKLNYKGMPHASVIRKPSANKPEHTPEEQELYNKIFAKTDTQTSPVKKKRSRSNSIEDKSDYSTPKYIIKHRSHIDIQEFTENKDAKLNVAIPKELIVEINLPLLKSSGDITLDVTEKTVQLLSENPAKYKLNLTLPYSVNESCGSAKFDKDLKVLFITLPVKRNAVTALACSDCNDSGIESEYGSPGIFETEKNSSEECLVSEVTTETCKEILPQFRTSFLEEDVQYSLPEFSCHVFENKIAFTLNVKNVDENSVDKIFEDAGSSIHIKFTSVSSSFYPSHYAVYIKIPSRMSAEETTIEVWDNNVILQVSVTSNKSITSYFFGLNKNDLVEKYVEEPQIVNATLQDNDENIEVNVEKNNQLIKIFDIKEETSLKNKLIFSKDDTDDDDKYLSKAIDIMGTSYESSGDELSCNSFSPRKNKGILKKLSANRFKVSRSVSESSLDDYIYPSSFENCHASLDSVIPENPEDEEEVSTSLKKTVRFNDVVMSQLFR